MEENKVTVVIDRPVEEVFAFTTNPVNTHLWIESIQEELADEFPPEIGTRYKNRGDDSDWDVYTVIEYEPAKTFTLSDVEGNYHVRYTYRRVNDSKTEMVYFEWVESGELDNPFTQDTLNSLKSVMEAN